MKTRVTKLNQPKTSNFHHDRDDFFYYFHFSGCPVLLNVYANPQSVGFGTICEKSNKYGLPTVVPVIPESELDHDSFGLTVNNGAFMVFER